MQLCIDTLRQLDGAKQQWALETGKSGLSVPDPADIQPYLGHGDNGFLPFCPTDPQKGFDSSYGLNDLATLPQCKATPDTHVFLVP